MTFIQISIIVLLFALLMLALWEMKFWLLRGRIGGKRTGVTVIVTANGSPAELEQSVKGILWMIDNKQLDPKTRIVIRGSEANSETAEMARILERENGAVRVEN